MTSTDYSPRSLLPTKRRLVTHGKRVKGMKVHVSIGFYPDGRVGEVFIDTAKAGTEMKELMSGLGKLISLALQHNVSPLDIAHILSDSHPDTVNQYVAELLRDEHKNHV